MEAWTHCTELIWISLRFILGEAAVLFKNHLTYGELK